MLIAGILIKAIVKLLFAECHKVVFEAMRKQLNIEEQCSFDRSKEYWIGWAVAYYQWFSNRKYIEIFTAVSYSDFEKMYYTLHEADISKFVEIVDKKIKERYADTNQKKNQNDLWYNSI